jgi:hypothetical protein
VRNWNISSLYHPREPLSWLWLIWWRWALFVLYRHMVSQHRCTNYNRSDNFQSLKVTVRAEDDLNEREWLQIDNYVWQLISLLDLHTPLLSPFTFHNDRDRTWTLDNFFAFVTWYKWDWNYTLGKNLHKQVNVTHRCILGSSIYESLCMLCRSDIKF